MDSGLQQQVTDLCQQMEHCLVSRTSSCSCQALFATLQKTICSPAHKHLQDMVWNDPALFQPILKHHACCYKAEPYMEEISKLNNSFSNLSSFESNSHLSQDNNTKRINHESQLLSSVSPESIDTLRIKQASADNEKAAVDKTCILEPESETVLSPRAPFDEEFANTWVMCLANLVAGNTAAVDQLSTSFSYDKMGRLLECAPCYVAQKWCAVLYNVLLQKQHIETFCRAVQVPVIVSRLCSLYCDEGPHACFARYCLEALLCHQPTQDSLLQCWRSLVPLQRVLCLTCLTDLLQDGTSSKRPARPSPVTAAFLVHVYQVEAGKILSNDEQQLADCDPQVVREACTAVLAAASSSCDAASAAVRGNDSLLFITICFLKALNKATFGSSAESLSESERWSKQHLLEGDAGAATAGLRCDLVMLIGNLVHCCPANQEQLRQHEGLEEVFCSCRRDDSNPLIQEAVIFTLGCSLRDNPQNAEYLRAKLNTGKGDKDCPIMNRLGLVPNQYVQLPTDQ